MRKCLVVYCLIFLAAAQARAATITEKEAISEIKAAIKQAEAEIKTADAEALATFTDNCNISINDYKTGAQGLLGSEVANLRADIVNLVFGAEETTLHTSMGTLASSISNALTSAGGILAPPEAQAGAFSQFDKLQAFLEKEAAKVRKKALSLIKKRIAVAAKETGGLHTYNVVIPPIVIPQLPVTETEGFINTVKSFTPVCIIAASSTSASDDGIIEVAGFVLSGNVVVTATRVGVGIPVVNTATPDGNGVWFTNFPARREGATQVSFDDNGNFTVLYISTIAVP